MSTHTPSPHSLLDLLPGIFASDDLGRRMVRAFDDTLAPALSSLDNLASYLDPAITPADFLDWVGAWVAAIDHPDIPEQRRRQLVANAVRLHAMRGTAAGLAELLRLCTGTDVAVTDSGACVYSTEPGAEPPGEAAGMVTVLVQDTVDTRLVELVVATTRPAHVAHRIEVGGTR